MSSRGPQNIIWRAAIGPRAASLRPLLYLQRPKGKLSLRPLDYIMFWLSLTVLNKNNNLKAGFFLCHLVASEIERKVMVCSNIFQYIKCQSYKWIINQPLTQSQDRPDTTWKRGWTDQTAVVSGPGPAGGSRTWSSAERPPGRTRSGAGGACCCWPPANTPEDGWTGGHLSLGGWELMGKSLKLRHIYIYIYIYIKGIKQTLSFKAKVSTFVRRKRNNNISLYVQ